MDDQLKEKLANVAHLIPVNYIKAKCRFKNNELISNGVVLKFVAMRRFKTDRAVVMDSPKSISRMLKMNDK